MQEGSFVVYELNQFPVYKINYLSWLIMTRRQKYIPYHVLTLCACLLLSLPVFAADSPRISQYRLGAGDQLRIQVYDEDDLYLEARVGNMGTISYPFLGEIRVLGNTPTQLEAYITAKLKGDYLINPKVSVDILEYRPFYVNGEVEQPGDFPFQPGITVRKAISVAGGFKERASKDKIFLIKENDERGKPIKVSLDELVSPGDIITVEESFF